MPRKEGLRLQQLVSLFKSLGMQEKLAQYDANAVGQAILDCLLRPFQGPSFNVRQNGSLLVDPHPVLHWPSEQVFYRIPVIVPYDAPIFVFVKNGDISGMRSLFLQGEASVDVVDPYGLGLLNVRLSFARDTVANCI
jgi:hypothetical protein